MTGTKTILVTGATGNQGGAATRALLRRGWAVRALVRDPGALAARELQDLGAALATGDLDDAPSLHRAVEGAYGVFSVQPLASEPEALAAEVRRGKAVADAALDAGVEHLVYSSVGGAERRTGIDHFESKAEIERHILGLGLPATILRPVFFMDNLLHYAGAQGERVMELPVLPDRPMQMIAAADIGRIAATAFDEPAEFAGARLEIAGDELPFTRVAEIYQRVTGVPTRLVPLPIEERMFEWFAEDGYRADLPALRERFPGLLTFERFLSRQASTAAP
ncbi:NmrA/HSCARG family protein [Nocardiopsis potens]|uniref:NmrA/HSCARG family protein n=1 Tax=Nocardiopsis potens TaxID=1246458 RepID=UPI00034AD58C|nr:NmrA/HSCARG family protein [Nocardiopsis potens]